MAPDVRIRHCTLTVRRRGGWAWPSDPTSYVQAAMDAVERALTDALDDAGLPADADLHVHEPVRLSIGRDGMHSWPDDPPLAHLLRALAANAGRGEPRAPTDRAEAGRPTAPGIPTSSDPPATISRSGATGASAGEIPAAVSARGLARTLGQWSSSGRLEAIVAGWPEQTVRRWLSLIYRVSRAFSGDGADLSGDAVRRIAATVQSAAADDPAHATRAHIDLLMLVATIVGAGGRLPGTATLRAAAEACGAGWPDDPAPASGGGPVGSAATGPAHPRHPAERTDAPAWATPPSPIAMVPAVPFLTLVQLVRIGYASAMVAAAGGSLEILRALVAGIAGKVLPPPARGWRREPADDAAVTAAGGLDPAALAHAAHILRGAESNLARPLRDALVALCAEERTRTERVEVTEGPDGIVCGDLSASLPMAWVASREELSGVLTVLGEPPVHRSDEFSGFAAGFAARRAFTGVELPGLERALGAAAGAALGSLAHELWPESAEAASPQLLLTRFADLEARVQRSDRLSIAIPRGRRWMDLHRCGLIDAWSVPWEATGIWELVTW